MNKWKEELEKADDELYEYEQKYNKASSIRKKFMNDKLIELRSIVSKLEILESGEAMIEHYSKMAIDKATLYDIAATMDEVEYRLKKDKK